MLITKTTTTQDYIYIIYDLYFMKYFHLFFYLVSSPMPSLCQNIKCWSLWMEGIKSNFFFSVYFVFTYLQNAMKMFLCMFDLVEKSIWPPKIQQVGCWEHDHPGVDSFSFTLQTHTSQICQINLCPWLPFFFFLILNLLFTSPTAVIIIRSVGTDWPASDIAS